MDEREYLKGKKVFIVDDEADIIESLTELLDMCELTTAGDYETAVNMLNNRTYDAAILDIMGVSGYKLLKITQQKQIPTLMLTAHALNANNFVKSIEQGALAYIPKDKLPEIAVFLTDVLQAHAEGTEKFGKWFHRLESFFDKKFGYYWREKTKDDPEFWKKYI